ncbi:MAG: hypothetical protein AAGJ31_08085 [Verrucomicrobiota bacterium]
MPAGAPESFDPSFSPPPAPSSRQMPGVNPIADAVAQGGSQPSDDGISFHSSGKKPGRSWFPVTIAALVTLLLMLLGVFLWKSDVGSMVASSTGSEMESSYFPPPSSASAEEAAISAAEILERERKYLTSFAEQEAAAVEAPAMLTPVPEEKVQELRKVVSETGSDLPTISNPESILSAEQVEEPKAAIPVTGSPEPSVDNGVENDITPLEDARNVVRSFLEAKSWNERIPYIYGGVAIQTGIRDHYQKHPDEAVKDYRLDYFHSERSIDGLSSTFIFFLSFPGKEDGLPILVRAKGGRVGVDWETYQEFQGQAFAKFAEEKPKEPADFRVVIQRVTYWEDNRDSIPGIENLICYKVDPPYPGFTRFAFVPKNTVAGKRMVQDLSWETDPLAATVRMRFDAFSNGNPYLTVDEIVSRSWSE